MDVYVWVRTNDRPAALSQFIDRYVDAAHPGEPRFQAFRRTFVAQTPSPGDADALAELHRDTEAVNALSLYLRAKTHYEAIITVTEEGDLVLGLGLDDPDNHPETQREASELLASMMDEFQASSGIAGVELCQRRSKTDPFPPVEN
jgi:hypothetical protein